MNIVTKLPMAAEMLVPHRRPFLLVDRLIEFSGVSGVVESYISMDNLFVTEDGHLKEIAMVEILAQSAAAVKGYSDLQQGKEISMGFLVDIRGFNFMKRCNKGDTIQTRIEIAKSFSGFSLINGSLVCSGNEIASGSIKLCVPDDSQK